MNMPSTMEKLWKRICNGFALGYTPFNIILLLFVRVGIPYHLKVTHHISNKVATPPPRLTLVISLSFREDRRSRILTCKEMQNLEWKFLDALHGKSLQINSLPSEILSTQSKRSLSSGSVGAILSHYAAWKELLLTQEDSFYLFEDDIVLASGFKEAIESIWTEVPGNFDIIYLGSGLSITNDMLARISRRLYVPHFPRRGLYGYILSRTGIHKLLRLVFPIKILFGGIDTVIGNLVRQGALNAYHVYPHLCTTDMTFTSNIYNPSVPDKLLHKNEF